MDEREKYTKSAYQEIKERLHLPASWSPEVIGGFWLRGCRPNGTGFKDLRRLTDEEIDRQLR